MKILVTGGAGYIGAIVAAELLSQGNEVVVLDDLSTGHMSSIPKNATFIQGNVLDKNLVTLALSGVDAVIHFAAKSIVSESMQNPDFYWHNNVDGTRNLLDAMVLSKVKKIVFSSTAAVYGDPVEIPITENSPTEPKSPYGDSKLAVDNLLSEFCQKFEIGAISLRYFNVAGAVGELGELHTPETHLIPRAIASLLNQESKFEIYGDDWPTPDGTCIRDYIHVSDLTQAHIKALNKIELRKHLIFNLGTETGSSVMEVINSIEKVTGKKINRTISSRRPGDPAILVASNRKARVELCWQPTRTLDEIVSDAYEFAKENL